MPVYPAPAHLRTLPQQHEHRWHTEGVLGENRQSIRKQISHRERCIIEEGMGNSTVVSMESAHKFNAAVGLTRI